MSALRDDIPFGPFEGSPIHGYTTGGRNARLHASRTCSPLKGSNVVAVTMPLEAATVRRMCDSCAEWGPWARPTTAVGVFLGALSGMGLLYELERCTPGYFDDDLEGTNVARAVELLAAGDWPDDEDLWDEYEQARKLRDELLLPSWRDSAESLSAAHETINHYPWLAEWARPQLRVNADYTETLR